LAFALLSLKQYNSLQIIFITRLCNFDERLHTPTAQRDKINTIPPVPLYDAKP
jgi:hypothetical protein